MGGFPSFRISEFPSYQVSESPSFRVSEFPSFQVSKLPSYRVSKFPSFQDSKGGREGGPKRGLELIMWSQGRWEAYKKTAPNGADTKTDILTNGHGDSMTNSVQRGRVGENALSTPLPQAEGLTAMEAWVIACIVFVFAALMEYTGILLQVGRGLTRHVELLLYGCLLVFFYSLISLDVLVLNSPSF